MAVTTTAPAVAPEAAAKKSVSMADYANQIMTERANANQAQYANLQNELKAATPTFNGVSSGYSTKDYFNPAVRSGQDPLSQEERSKLGVFESYIGQAPKPYDPMHFTEALSLARYRNDPFYDQQMSNTLKSQNKAAVKTGFYGQLPAEQLKQNAIAANEAARTQQSYENAMDLMKADDASKYQQYGLQYQSYRDMMGDLLKDYGLVNDAYTSDWNKNYQTWQEEWNRWMEEQKFAEQVRQFNAQLAASAARGGGGGGGGSSDDWYWPSEPTSGSYYGTGSPGGSGATSINPGTTAAQRQIINNHNAAIEKQKNNPAVNKTSSPSIASTAASLAQIAAEAATRLK